MGELVKEVVISPLCTTAGLGSDLANEDVLRLEISVEDIVSVTVGEASEQLEVEGLRETGEG